MKGESQPHFWTVTQQLVDTPRDTARIDQEWSKTARRLYPMRNNNDIRLERVRIRPVMAAINFLTRMQFAADVLSQAKSGRPTIPVGLPRDSDYYADQVVPLYPDGPYDLFMRTFVHAIKQASKEAIRKLEKNERWQPLWQTYCSRYAAYYSFRQKLPDQQFEVPGSPLDFLCEVNSKENTHTVMRTLVGLRGAVIRARNVDETGPDIVGHISAELSDELTRHAHTNIEELTYPATVNGQTLTRNGLSSLDPQTGEFRSGEQLISVLHNWHNIAELQTAEPGFAEFSHRGTRLQWKFGHLKSGPWRRPQECHAIVPVTITANTLSGFLTQKETHSVLHHYRDYFAGLVNSQAPAESVSADAPKTVKILSDLSLPYANELARHTIFTTTRIPASKPT